MREPASSLRLGALLPAAIRGDVFDPAVQDLRITRLSSRSRLASLRFAAAVVWLLLQCWLVSLTSRRHRPDRTRKERAMSLLYHVRHGLRLLGRQPTFTIAAVLTLALGIGANTAVFAVVEAVLLRPLPYPDADDLVVFRHRDVRTGITKQFIAIGDYVDLAARQQSVDAFAAYGSGSATITADGDPFIAPALSAGPGLLAALGVQAAAGRLIDPGDSRQGAAPVVVLGHTLWVSTFRSDPNVVGRRIRVGQLDREIVGVATPGFRFPPTADMAVILPMSVPATAPAGRKNGWIFALGRLKPGRTIESATADVNAISAQMEREHPEQNIGSRYYAVSLRDELVGSTKQPLILMLAAVGVVLLIACANVGNLLLARALGRRQEMALRVALGASRGQILAQLLAESMVLAVAAGAVGLVAAWWGVPALVALMPSSVGVSGLADAGLNVGVLAFTLGLALLTTIAFGLITAAGAFADRTGEVLVAPGRVSAGRRARRAASVLVITEVALAVVLLIAAGLILRTTRQLLSVDPGFQRENVVAVDIALPAAAYPTPPARHAFYARAFTALRAIPGVEAAGAAAVTPLTGNNWTSPFERADRPVPAGERPPDVGWQSASGGFFETLRIPLKSGRYFDATDRPDSPPVVIVSEALERRFFPGERAVGRRARLGGIDAEIVGVVGDIRRASLTDEPRADLYMPFERGPGNQITLFFRTSQPGDQADVRAVSAALRAIEPKVVIGAVTTLARVAERSMAETTLALWLLGVFAAIALALAAIGVYGVMSYAVRQRAREIGMRVALGATRGDIVWLVARQGGVIAVLGLTLGVAGGLLAAQSLSALLFQVSIGDPWTLIASIALLATTLAVACYVPARRAARLDAARTLAAN